MMASNLRTNMIVSAVLSFRAALMYSRRLMSNREVCLAMLVWLAAPVGAQHPNWTQTSNELVWRNKYTNCDKGWAVELPNGAIAHGSLPPNPNHGFLISAANPGTTNEVTLDVPRVIVISDEYDAMELHTARAYLDFRLKNTKGATVLNIRETSLQGVRGNTGRYKVKSGGSEQIVECQIILRRGIVYELLLRTTDQHYDEDSRLFAQVRAGFRLLPIPKGECINP